MTSLWGCQHDCLPRVSIVTMLTRGRLSCWQPHRDVIFVSLYRTPPPPPPPPRHPKLTAGANTSNSDRCQGTCRCTGC